MIFEPLIRPRYFGDEEKARTKIGLAKKMVQLIMNAAQFQGLKQDIFMRVYDRGNTQIKATLSFNCILLDIWCRPTAKKRERKDVEIITRPIVLVAAGYYSHPGIPDSASINAYYDYSTYPRKVMLYDVIDDCVIETTIDGVAQQSITTTQLKNIYSINVWHPHELTGVLTDKGFRLSDDIYHEKSYPLSRYLINMEGFTGDGFVYAHGAHEYPAVGWGAGGTPPPLPPLPPTAPPIPSSMTGHCIWIIKRHENLNRNEVTVDTKGTGVEAVNSHTKYVFYDQGDPAFCNAKLCPSCGGCPVETIASTLIVPGSWLVSKMTKYGNPADRRIFEDYGRFGGSYRLTTRDKYPSLVTGCVGYAQTIYDDYQDQASHIYGGGGSPGSQCFPPCPTYIYSYERTINIIVECSFGEIYRTVFSHGTYNYWTCAHMGTQGSDGDPFQFPGVQQANISLEAGIIDSKVVSVSLAVAGTEHLAWPYTGSYSVPGTWDNLSAYKELRANGVKAGINITELDKNLDYVDMIMSANDIEYFSLETGQPIQWGDEEIDELEEGEVGNFETAVNALVEEYYGEDKKLVDPRICLEARVIEQYVEKNIETGAERIIGYGSCKQPNPWLTPKIGKPFWRPL